MTGWPRREAPDLDRMVRRVDKLANRRAVAFLLGGFVIALLCLAETCKGPRRDDAGLVSRRPSCSAGASEEGRESNPRLHLYQRCALTN